MENKNLVIIDYQNDFVALDGLLTCGQQAINIENHIINKINDYKNNNIFVTLDTHNINDWEGTFRSQESAIYPAHCIMGTNGHKLYGKVEDALKITTFTNIYKNTFATKKLAQKIIEKNDCNKKILVEFCGVATSVCVFQNVISLYNYFVTNNVEFEIIIDKHGVACFDEDLETSSLNYLKNILNITIK